jgi:enamine deaminase RidA (YjgF/YER057c/UK114 family)
LEGAGASPRDVIKTNIYVTNMADYRQKTREIRLDYFPRDFPASTLVEVKSLARPEFMVEIEAVAAVG